VSWRRRPIRDLNNSEQFRSDAIRRCAGRAVEYLRVQLPVAAWQRIRDGQVRSGVFAERLAIRHWHVL